MTTFGHDSGRKLRDDRKTYKRLEINYTRNKEQDQTVAIDEAAAAFDYAACRDSYWNPERFSLMHGTPVWDEASAAQRVLLNQLYWVAYYSQIISAEIATIYYNQTSAAGLYAIDDFRLICDTLDPESAQERAHIAAFKKIGESVEQELFGERVFTYPMRGPFSETMIYADTTPFREAWKRVQLGSFGLLSSGNAFIACQYFTIRGLRTLNGKIVQHQLSRFYDEAEEQPSAPIPAAISYHHFKDESYHFNSSMLIAQDVVRALRPPTRFERKVVNMAIMGCQRDHARFSIAVNGIFWHDPALFPRIYQVLRSGHFALDRRGALDLMRRSFCTENQAMHEARATHETARLSYQKFIADMPHLSRDNKEMSLMGQNTMARTLADNRDAMARFERAA